MMIVIENSIIHSFATGMFFVCPSIFRLVFETTYIPDIFRVIIVSPTVFCVEAPLICLDSIKCAESAKRFGSLKKTKTASFISLRKPLLSTSILILQCHLTKLLISNVNEEKWRFLKRAQRWFSSKCFWISDEGDQLPVPLPAISCSLGFSFRLFLFVV